MTYRELVIHDLKRARIEKECTKAKPTSAAITLSQCGPTMLSPNMLSHMLRDRFAHIFANTQ